MKLAGIRVLDLSSFIPGPYLTLAMADHGAEVIKVEAPGGDHYRHIGIEQGDQTALFRTFNRGKKSIVLDLKSEAERETFLRLAETADVIVEASRPGTAARLGIGYDAVSARNPRIVYCSISAFGQDGPDARRPAHDLALEAVSGFLSMNVDADNRPVIPAIPVADITAALHGLSGILMALLARQTTGQGDYIDISMQEALLGSMLNILPPAQVQGRQPIAGHERTTGGGAFYSIYETGDGKRITLAGQEPKFIHALLRHLGRMDLAPLCDQGPGPHQEPVFALLRQTFAALSLVEAETLVQSLDLCWGTVKSLPEALEDNHLAARGLILRDAQGHRHIGPPIRFRNDPARPSLSAPALGADQAEIVSPDTGI